MSTKEQNKEILYYESYCLKREINKVSRTNVVRSNSEEKARFAYDCGREYLIRTYKENGKMYTEEWNPDKLIWQPSCTNCFHADVCTDDTCAADGCDKYFHEEEIRMLREYKSEQERKRREGLIIELPFPLDTPVLKITAMSYGTDVASYELVRHRFLYADISEVGKTVFPLSQAEKAKEILEEMRKTLEEHYEREKEGQDYESEFRYQHSGV